MKTVTFIEALKANETKRTIYVNEYEGVLNHINHDSQELANKSALKEKNYRTIKFIEVIEEETK